MITISNLSANYIKEISIAETAAVAGGFADVDSYNFKFSAVDITQLNLGSVASFNAVGVVVTNQ